MYIPIFLRLAQKSRHTRSDKIKTIKITQQRLNFPQFKNQKRNHVRVHTSAIRRVQLMTRVDTGRRIDLPRPRTGVVTTSSRSVGVSSSIMTRTGGCGSSGSAAGRAAAETFRKRRVFRNAKDADADFEFEIL